jgi:hypothetical protein
MKNLKHICFAFIMMIACSVGFANASPPKTTATFIVPIVPSFQNVINSEVIAIQNQVAVHVTVIQDIELANARIHADAIHSKEAVLPSPKVKQLSKYIHFNLITLYSVNKITPRARSSDTSNQNKRC